MAEMLLGNAAHFLVVIVGYVPFRQPGLSLTILQVVIKKGQMRGEEHSPARE